MGIFAASKNSLGGVFFGIFSYSATVGRTIFFLTMFHTRLSCRCVGAGTSHPCRSRVSAASIAHCLFRMDQGPWLEISRLLMVFFGQCCINQSRSFCACSLDGCSIAASAGRLRPNRSKIVVTAVVRSVVCFDLFWGTGSGFCFKNQDVGWAWLRPPSPRIRRQVDSD